MFFLMHFFIQMIMSLTFGVNMILATTYFINIPYWCYKYVPGIQKPFNVLAKAYPRLMSVDPPEGDNPRERSKSPSFFARLVYYWNRIPLKLLIALVILSLLLKEFFPLSHWPMYANPQPSVAFLHIRDKDMNPLMPAGQYLRSSMSKIFKHYRALCHEFWGSSDRWIGHLKREMKCGNVTLYSVMKFSRHSKREELEKRLPFKLIKTYLTMDSNHQVHRKTDIVGILAQLPPPLKATKNNFFDKQ